MHPTTTANELTKFWVEWSDLDGHTQGMVISAIDEVAARAGARFYLMGQLACAGCPDPENTARAEFHLVHLGEYECQPRKLTLTKSRT